MTLLKVGTRGSELALIQTRLVCSLLNAAHPQLEFQEIIIRTHGDRDTQSPFDIHWPAGGFTGAIEQALLRGEIDMAVHSYKDLPTADTPGLVVAAVPQREEAHDVFLSARPVDLSALPAGFRVGTSSPRRSAQMRWYCGPVAVRPLRGNVPTRLAKLESGELDAIVLAAAGLKRLNLRPKHAIDLPMERFVPAPAQGALAIQAREGDRAGQLASEINHPDSERAVQAEREFLRAIGAGCHTPAAALSVICNDQIQLTAQLFSDDGKKMNQGSEAGNNGTELARKLAERLRAFQR